VKVGSCRHVVDENQTPGFDAYTVHTCCCERLAQARHEPWHEEGEGVAAADRLHQQAQRAECGGSHGRGAGAARLSLPAGSLQKSSNDPLKRANDGTGMELRSSKWSVVQHRVHTSQLYIEGAGSHAQGRQTAKHFHHDSRRTCSRTEAMCPTNGACSSVRSAAAAAGARSRMPCSAAASARSAPPRTCRDRAQQSEAPLHVQHIRSMHVTFKHMFEPQSV
jgi:hypothetical protein